MKFGPHSRHLQGPVYIRRSSLEGQSSGAVIEFIPCRGHDNIIYCLKGPRGPLDHFVATLRANKRPPLFFCSILKSDIPLIYSTKAFISGISCNDFNDDMTSRLFSPDRHVTYIQEIKVVIVPISFVQTNPVQLLYILFL